MVSEILKVFLLSMAPFGELRVSIPVGLGLYHLNWKAAYLVSVIGNLVPPIFFLLFLEPISQWLSKESKVFQRIFNWLFERTRRKYQLKKERLGYLALLALVAIPLPLTGAWTGSLVAFLFGIPFKAAFPIIALGVVIAGLIVLGASFLGIALGNYFGWQALAGLLLLGLFLWLVYNYKTNKIKTRKR